MRGAGSKFSNMHMMSHVRNYNEDSMFLYSVVPAKRTGLLPRGRRRMAGSEANAPGTLECSTADRIASADELDHYIKVTNPSAWATVFATLLLVGSIAVWAIVAVVPVTVNTTGIVLQSSDTADPIVVCWVDKQTADRIGDFGVKASVDGIQAKGARMDRAPMSASEVVKFLGSDFYADSIDLADWNYPVIIEPYGEVGHSDYAINTALGAAHLVPVSLVVSEKNPISIVMGKG